MTIADLSTQHTALVDDQGASREAWQSTSAEITDNASLSPNDEEISTERLKNNHESSKEGRRVSAVNDHDGEGYDDDDDDDDIARTATIQRPGGDYRVLRRPGEHEPSECEQDKIEKRLPEDTFSMVMISPYWTPSFWFGMLVSIFQFATYVLVLVDVTDMSDGVNPFGFPANVDVAVRVAEVIALIILVPLQDEVIEGLILINDGYQRDALESKFSDASKTKFVLSVTLRMIVGALSIVTSFLLIMIESDVLDIFFNFIALQFINDLDNLSFELATIGLIGYSIQSGANEVSDVSYFTDKRFRRRYPLVVVFFLIMGSWCWVFVLQQKGRFVSTSLEVQFGDDLDSVLATFSGIYDRSDTPLDAGRFRYLDRLSGTAFFGYCEDRTAWTFTYMGSDPCDFNAVSSQTDSYEITDSVLWNVGTPDDTLIPLEPFYMDCFFCADEDNPCRDGGFYSNGECICPTGRFGTRCSFSAACHEIFFEKGENYKGPIDLPTDYEMIYDGNGKVVTMYSKPVYVDRVQNGLILFNGRRWYLTSMEQLNATSASDLALKLGNGWQLFRKPITSAFVSSPSDIGTLTDSATPIRATWYRASTPPEGSVMQRPILDQASPSFFECALCDSLLYPCMYGNPCFNGTCQCIDGSTGKKCQVIPDGDGKCDRAFNVWNFAYDSGDCCRASCKSSLNNYCGYTGKVDVGFPQCADNAFSCDPGQTCWASHTSVHELESARGWAAERQTTLHMSPNGQLVVLAYPRANIVQFFDLVDDTWVQRGDDIIGPRGSLYGHAIALTSFHGTILDFIAEPADVWVGIGAFDPNTDNNTTYIVHILTWDSDRFVPHSSEIRFTIESALASSHGTHFDFFNKGRYLAAQVGPTTISIFDLDNESNEVATVSCLDLNLSCDMRSLKSVSETGSLLLQSSSSDVFHVVGSSEDVASANWSVSLVAINAQRSIMSKDGRVIAVVGGNPARFQLFVIRDGIWAKIATDLLVDNGWTLIEDTVSLSTDGLTIAFALSGTNGEGNKVEVFRLHETNGWYQLGNAIPSDTVPRVATSYDSSVLAIADNSGQMRTFHISPFCRSGESYFRLFMILEKDINVFWTLEQALDFPNATLQVMRSPDYDPIAGYRKILEEICLPERQCSLLNITIWEGSPTLNQSLLSVRVDNEEVLYLRLANGSHFLGDCE
ncbi:hypothetical protein ACA910_009879 [Epithemia clementina (nom. ined.)]